MAGGGAMAQAPEEERQMIDGHCNVVWHAPDLAGIKVLAVPTDEALPLYNLLRDQGVRVAIHVHSTC